MARATRREPWERQPGESDPAYAAFTTYRDQGLGSRSGAKVAATLGKSITLISRWSSDWSWVIRAAAFDQHEERVHQQLMHTARIKADARNVKLAGVAMNAAVQGLAALDTRNLSASDIARLAEVASKLERFAFGQPTEIVQVTSGPAVGSQVDAAALTDEERALRLQQLMREGKSRLVDMGLDVDEEVS